MIEALSPEKILAKAKIYEISTKPKDQWTNEEMALICADNSLLYQTGIEEKIIKDQWPKEIRPDPLTLEEEKKLDEGTINGLKSFAFMMQKEKELIQMPFVEPSIELSLERRLRKSCLEMAVESGKSDNRQVDYVQRAKEFYDFVNNTKE